MEHKKPIKILTDENIFSSSIEILRKNGIDVKDIKEMGLSGISDLQVIEIAKNECRALVTLDLHFSNILLFPPSHYYGIIVIRTTPSIPKIINEAIEKYIQVWQTHKLQKTLVIVEKNKHRVFK